MAANLSRAAHRELGVLKLLKEEMDKRGLGHESLRDPRILCFFFCHL